jgi:hypothetical protein
VAVIFFSVFSTVLAAICLLGLAGGFMTAPFRAGRRFILLLSPAGGMLTLALLVTLFYTTDKLSFQQSAALALVLCVSLTVLSSIRWRPSRLDLCTSIVLLLSIAAIATGMFCAATLIAGSPSILYIDGSDHGGYAHAADWLLSHSFSQQPLLSPEYPYDSWPVMMFTGDFRYSAFVFMTLMAMLNQTSGLFAYDLACAVAFSVAVLGIAAVFARSMLTIVGLSLCLMTTTWFELGRDGFFGKLMAYPSCLFLLGLFMTSYRGMSLQKMASFVLFTVGVATMHSGFITAFFFGAVAGLFICADAFFEKDRHQAHLTERFMVLAAIMLVALATNGMFSRPVPGPGNPAGYFVDWASLLPHLLEIQNPTRNYLPVPESYLPFLSVTAFLLHVALVAIAVLRRNAIAVALTASPLLIFLLLIVLDAAGATSSRYATYQFVSIFASFGLCGAACLFDDPAKNRAPIRRMVPIAAMCAVLILVRMPRTIKSLQTYVFNPPNTQIYRLADFDAIAAVAGANPLLADVRDDLSAIAALVELGRRGIKLQWSPASWKVVVGYRAWASPTYANEPTLILVDKRISDDQRSPIGPELVVYESAQYRLRKLPLRGDTEKPVGSDAAPRE